MHHGKSNMDVRTRPSAVRSDGLLAFLVSLYNQGYKAGHHDTVESQYVDICEADMRTYHADVVMQIRAEANAQISGGTPSAEAGCSASFVAQPPRDVSELYHELLYAVARKFPGESRHETALRYIRDTESRVCKAGSCKQNSAICKGKGEG